MRADTSEGKGFANSKKWQQQKYHNSIMVSSNSGDSQVRANSFSGSEANQFFVSQNGKQFCNLSLISSIDSIGDGRGFAMLDYDNDGWQDIALISNNRPRFQLFRNRMGEFERGKNRIQVQLEGGNHTSGIRKDLSNRDGIGVQLVANHRSGKSFRVQNQAGEGNVSQNSSKIWLGFSDSDPIVEIEVVWPSGNRQTLKNPSLERVNLIREPRN